MLLLAGSTADTGFNLQFNGPLTCINPSTGRCHELDTPRTRMGMFGGHTFCIVVRVGIYNADSALPDWNSSFVVGMSSTDSSIMTVATGALTRAGSGTGVWDGEGFLFHMTKAGVLELVVDNSDTATTMGSVNLFSFINSHNDIGEPTFLDLGVRIEQDDLLDTDSGTLEGWYRCVHPTDCTRQWTSLGTISGASVLPSAVNAEHNLTLEFIQGAGNAGVCSPGPGCATSFEYGFEFFLSGVYGYYTREEYLE